MAQLAFAGTFFLIPKKLTLERFDPRATRFFARGHTNGGLKVSYHDDPWSAELLINNAQPIPCGVRELRENRQKYSGK